MVPVGTAQVGCVVAEAVGATGPAAGVSAVDDNPA